MDVAGFVRTVLASGYAGPLSLEVFNDDFRAGAASMTARDGLRSLIHAEAEAGQDIPSPSVLDGIEFIEFAVDEPARAELAIFLSRLGFRAAGWHRSKAVDLFRQGRVNLVLNAEPESAAAEHFQRHGASVCAMALRVDDVARVLARAKTLLVPEWRERIGTGERRIPAVRGPDGTLIFCLAPTTSRRTGVEKTSGTTTFTSSPATTPAAALLLSIISPSRCRPAAWTATSSFGAPSSASFPSPCSTCPTRSASCAAARWSIPPVPCA
jgi:4-hydroxyphenylpyruvate dioxygenase